MKEIKGQPTAHIHGGEMSGVGADLRRLLFSLEDERLSYLDACVCEDYESVCTALEMILDTVQNINLRQERCARFIECQHELGVISEKDIDELCRFVRDSLHRSHTQ